jgi:hypothetical protein
MMATSNAVRQSLERIRAEAIRKARLGIAEKKSKVRVDLVEEAVQKLQQGVRGPVAVEVSNKVCRKVVDRFLTIFQDGLDQFREALAERTTFPNAPRSSNNEIMVYPEGCRFMYTDQRSQGVMIIEQQPQVRTVLISDRTKRHIPLPYVIFVVYYTVRHGNYNYAGLRVGFRNNPIKSLDDRLYLPSLPNFTEHQVCMGSYEGVSGGDTPSDVADDIIGTFWQSVFGSTFHGFSCGGTSVKSWDSWERVAGTNPLNILKAKWRQGKQLSDLISQYSEANSTGGGRQVNDFVQKTWNRLANEFNAEEAQILVQGAAQEILAQLLNDLALQPQ